MNLYHADAFSLLPQLAAESFDAVITDPPYSSGGKGMTRHQGKMHAEKYLIAPVAIDFDDGTRDQLSHHLWTCDWMRLCYRLLKPGGWCMVFTDWRQLPLTCNAMQCAGYIWCGINIWHKPNGLPQLGRFYRSDEFIVLGTKGEPPGGQKLIGTGARTYAQIWEGLLSRKERFHATSKPLGLMRHLMQVVTPGGRVLDPFAGGGATLIAAHQMGLDAVGIEKTEANYKTAAARIAELLPQRPLLP